MEFHNSTEIRYHMSV